MRIEYTVELYSEQDNIPISIIMRDLNSYASQPRRKAHGLWATGQDTSKGKSKTLNIFGVLYMYKLNDHLYDVN